MKTHLFSLSSSVTAAIMLVLIPFVAAAETVPEPVTLPASNVLAVGADASATLNGTVNPGGLPAIAWFEWGQSTAYGHATAPTNLTGGMNPVAVDTTLPSLSSGLVYHYRLVASNSLGDTHGADRLFWPPAVSLIGPNPLTNDCGNPFVDPGASVRVSPMSVAAGWYHSLALKVDGTVVGWGLDTILSPPPGSDPNYGQAVIPPGVTDVTAIAAGGWHSLALKSDGTVIGWGAGSNNTATLPHFGQLAVPSSATNVVAIAAGGVHSLALKSNGTVVGWGAVGEIPTSAVNVQAIAAGYAHDLALKADGRVVAWGLWNDVGQASTPDEATDVIAIAAGYKHSLALRADGTVVGWGWNNWGQATGVPTSGDPDSSYGVVSIGGQPLANVVAIAAGYGHSLALKADGTVIGWGGMETGIPGSATNVVMIASGWNHCLALKANGTVISWGEGSYGQTAVLGDLGNLDLTVAVDGTVDVDQPGSYVLTYSTASASGGAATATRTVLVVDAPSVATISAVNVIATRTNGCATLRAAVNPNGQPTSVWFEWGRDSSLDRASAVVNLEGGYKEVPATADLTNLVPGVRYHFRAVASNNSGLAEGMVRSFAVPLPMFITLATNGIMTIEVACETGIAVDIQTTTNLHPPVAWSRFTTLWSDTMPVVYRPDTHDLPQQYFRAVIWTNRSPELDPVDTKTVNENADLAFTITAQDPDVGQALTYGLAAGAPDGTSIGPTDGLFTWRPSEAQGPGTYNIGVMVTDDGDPPLSASRTFAVTVNEVNQAPVLDSIGNKSVHLGESLTFTAMASDGDLPAQTLTFSLVNPPTGATITPSGSFSWTPTSTGAYPITVKVTDDGAPAMSDAKTFTANVGQANQPPMVTVTEPSDGSNFLVPTHITITATASDSDGTVTKIEFYWSQGGLLGGEGKIGEAASAPYTVVWHDVLPGSYALTAKAFDNEGAAATSAAINVVVRSVPQLTGSGDSSGNVQLQWTFDWRGGLSDTDDGYQLQESTISSTSGFATVWSSLGQNDHQSPRQYTTTRSDGNYRYRVRARKAGIYSEWSDVVRVEVTPAPTVTRFVNNTAYLIYSLKIDNVERILPCYFIAPGDSVDLTLEAGPHSYYMLNGILDDFCVGMSPMYTFNGTWTQRQGEREVITFTDPTIQQILSAFTSEHGWYADWWDVDTLTPHRNVFVFRSDGTYSFYVDGEEWGSGSYQQVSRNGWAGTVTFVVRSNPDVEATLYEFLGWFGMYNGPGGQALQYFPL